MRGDELGERGRGGRGGREGRVEERVGGSS